MALFSSTTLDYLARGADEGRRNAELFDAACQFRDVGIAPEEAETQLIPRATLGGLIGVRDGLSVPFSGRVALKTRRRGP
jgi:hypothetical protein